MRRLLGKFLPIVTIAIFAHIIAPIAGSWAMSAAFDPIMSAPICANMNADGTSAPQPADHKADHQTCCTLCAVAHGNALADPGTVNIVPQQDVRDIAWSITAADFSPARYASDSQARAPPFHS